MPCGTVDAVAPFVAPVAPIARIAAIARYARPVRRSMRPSRAVVSAPRPARGILSGALEVQLLARPLGRRATTRGEPPDQAVRTRAEGPNPSSDANAYESPT